MRTRCSTLTATTRSSGIGSSLTRLVTRASRGRIGRHGDLCVVIDEHGREHHRFEADRANQLWLTDITDHKTAEGKLYLCAVKDAFSGRIVGCSMDSRMKAPLTVRAVRNAARMRGDVNGCFVHSDRGSQFRSRKLCRELAIHNLIGSMGRVASCGDNTERESFFSLLRKNVQNRRS
ncbi:DDE-type integrase/transposase/recombinase [Corynebacterium dentalis]|uniref:DDE-type integrase/transposase/recombinase n=1 Tax=Corynebacterium dentalis TaxID=2014528 RepID=UPI00289F5346|nr:DDE-type integrase/transposase/recombinase [Corynebacterium dentalis]